MYRYTPWQSVKVTEKKHERTGQAGIVQEQVKEDAETVKVKFDADGVTVAVPVDSVTVL
jgi:hypothetical protein